MYSSSVFHSAVPKCYDVFLFIASLVQNDMILEESVIVGNMRITLKCRDLKFRGHFGS